MKNFVKTLKLDYLYHVKDSLFDQSFHEIMVIDKILDDSFKATTIRGFRKDSNIGFNWDLSKDIIAQSVELKKEPQEKGAAGFRFFEIGHKNDHPEYLL